MDILVKVSIYFFITGVFVFNTWLSILNYRNRNVEVPEEVKEIYETQKYLKWKKYFMEKFRFEIITSTIDFIVIIILLTSKAFVWFNTIAKGISSIEIIQILILLGIYYLITFIIEVLASIYQTFVIEEKFGFNKVSKKTFVTDKLKELLLVTIIGSSIIWGLLAIYRNTGFMFLIYAWVMLVVIIFIFNIFYANVFIKIAYKLKPLEEGELKTKIFDFSNKVGYEVANISVINASKRTTRLNAFFSGFGKLKRIVLYDNLINNMSDEEIVAILAHEIGHYKRKHILWNFITMILGMSIYVLLLLLILNTSVLSTAFGFSEMNFGFSLVIMTILLSPLSIIVNLITSHTSRKYEYQADNYAAINYDKEHLITALKKLTKENFLNLTPHPLYVKVFYTHPPIVDRLRAIEKVQ